MIVYPFVLSVKNRNFSVGDQSKALAIDPLVKVGWGFVFATLAVLYAAVMETHRKNLAAPYEENLGNFSHCLNGSVDDYSKVKFQEYFKGKDEGLKPPFCRKIDGCESLNEVGLLDLSCIACDAVPTASSLSILYQIPQFVFVGIGEILASISALEFFYSEAPPEMRSVTSALNLICTGLGNWFTIPLIKIVNVGPKGEKWLPSDLNEGFLERYFYLLAGIMGLNTIA
eukprot:CAMPEP_0171452194 /NCGR_PEP_ID=MMETSP0945-20130129/396_1 /TAXON_ID=109269 /ORGANISM="Vaucheria litorea, Strain CCMP2940" /LENGTH=227 /DNA_ID=CAMNT_0011976805 /DNA_START=1011 /DNA_END=1691 /DNA_ORIENTATION=-